jgi:hypothetical protein
MRYCSVHCRREKPGTIDARLEAAILQLLNARPGRTICPSEAARLVALDDWKALMERTRRAARRLAASGRIQILQQGRPVDAGSIRGPVRLRSVRR